MFVWEWYFFYSPEGIYRTEWLTSEQETLVRAPCDDCPRIRIQVQKSFMKPLTNEYTWIKKWSDIVSQIVNLIWLIGSQ